MLASCVLTTCVVITRVLTKRADGMCMLCTCLCVLQLASRLEVLTRLRAEKAEAAALKQDPLNTVVDGKQESLARLQALRQQQQQPKQAAAASTPQDGEGADDGPSTSGRADAAAAGVQGGAAAAAAAGVQSDGGGGSGEDGKDAAAAGEDGGGGDPYAGMNARQRKLFELKQKMNQARKANENAIIAERKRMRVRLFVVDLWGMVVLLMLQQQ